MRRIVKWAGLIVLILAVVCVVNVLRLPAPSAGAAPVNLLQVDVPGAAQRLAGAVRIPTISYEDRSQIDRMPLARMAEYLESSFPRVHRQLKREKVNDFSLLYTWPGSDPAAKPILLLAHMDVVPIEPGTEPTWQHPPFSGDIADGYVWGRGALDDKGSLMAWMEAAEQLLAQDFQPKRTIYFAFGHDEEIGGQEGARQMAAILKARGVKAEFSLDEGGAITVGVIPGVGRPVASIMAAEKGYASFHLIARDVGGHSSRPPRLTAIGRLAHAVAVLERSQLPLRLAPPVTDMLERLAPEMPLGRRLVVANRWLFAPFIARAMSGQPMTNAMVRTTTAPTIFHAGIKDNVLPTEAYAVVNFRVLPGDSIADVERHIREAIGDPEIEVKLEDFSSEPTAVADTDTPAFAALERSAHEVFPGAVVSTGLMIAATDTRHYGDVWENRYNFLPVTLTADDFIRVHGANERIGVADYGAMIQYYGQVLRNTAGP